jgi:hypothetical protein
LICDYTERAAEISKHALANLITANRSRSSQAKPGLGLRDRRSAADGRGVGQLYRQYQSQISRRDLEVLTKTVRRELLQQHQAELRHLTWHVPGSVWSLDDAELAKGADQKLHLHQVRDLASRYKFTPLVGEQISGRSGGLSSRATVLAVWTAAGAQARQQFQSQSSGGR